MKICENCGKEVIVEGRTRFCSADCQRFFFDKAYTIKEIGNEQKIRKRYYLNICVYCGNEYSAYSKKGKYCSRDCMDKSLYNNSYKKSCVFCEKDYVTASLNSKFCSRSCESKSYRSRSPARICVSCGEEYRSPDKNRKFCSRTCFSKYRKN